MVLQILNLSGVIVVISTLCRIYEINENKLPLTIFIDKNVKPIYK